MMSGSKGQIGSLDRKRINDALDKQLEKSSPSTSRGINCKEKDRFSVPSFKQADHRSAGLSKNKCSDGELLSLTFLWRFNFLWQLKMVFFAKFLKAFVFGPSCDFEQLW